MSGPDGFWVQNERAAGFVAERRGPLDAIDIAYLELEHPLLVLRVDSTVTKAGREKFLRDMVELTKMPAVLLPPGYDVQVIGPCHTSAPPFELARWADDGGGV